MRHRKSFLTALAVVAFLIPSANLFSDDVQNVNYVERGFYRILSGPFELPRELVQRTLSGPLVLGTVDGALTGAVSALSSVLGGVFDVVRGTVPYAKYGPLFFL